MQIEVLRSKLLALNLLLLYLHLPVLHLQLLLQLSVLLLSLLTTCRHPPRCPLRLLHWRVLVHLRR
jgi:hypothetical protein